MVNQTFYELGTAPSVIRQLFAYGLEQAKIVGKENVFDYSIGNPSIPAPKKVNESIHKVVNETDSIQLHGYSMAAGFEEPRQAIAADLPPLRPGHPRQRAVSDLRRRPGPYLGDEGPHRGLEQRDHGHRALLP